jgi:hypothetical protein
MVWSFVKSYQNGFKGEVGNQLSLLTKSHNLQNSHCYYWFRWEPWNQLILEQFLIIYKIRIVFILHAIAFDLKGDSEQSHFPCSKYCLLIFRRWHMKNMCYFAGPCISFMCIECRVCACKLCLDHVFCTEFS